MNDGRNLTPGGYIELADMIFPIECDDGTMKEDSALQKWSTLMLEGTIKGGRPVNSAKDYKEQLEAAGFTNVVEKRYVWPLNRWPKDPTLKEIGRFTLTIDKAHYSNTGVGTWAHENVGPSLEGFSMAVFTRLLNWTKEELEVFLVDVRKEVNDPKIHAYFPM